MGTWGDRFIRFSVGLAAGATPGEVADAFRRAARSLEGLGGVLYVPRRTENRSSSGAWLMALDDDLALAANVELMFAPGAAIIPLVTPGSRAELKVGGQLSAGRVPIFGTAAAARRWRPDMPDDRVVARVRFTGNFVEQVHPEWWGAGSDDAELDTAALQAAFDAAYGDRRDGDRLLRPLPVSLSNTYRLEAPLRVAARIGAVESDPGTFEVRGLPGAVSAPNLICDRAFRGDAMVLVDGVDQVRFDEVRLDARSAAASCLILRPPGATASDEVGAQHLRHCVFHGARDHLVVLDGDAVTADVSARRVDALTIEGGTFSVGDGRAGVWPGALRLRTPPGVGVTLRGVCFLGSARTMIHATAASVSLTNCYFRNESVAPEDAAERSHRDGPDGGVDVFLDTSSGGAPASISAMHCRSHSAQFLVARGAGVPGAARDSNITGLRHDARSLMALFQGEQVLPMPPARRPWEIDVFEPTPIVPEAQKALLSNTPAPSKLGVTKVQTVFTAGVQKLVQSPDLPAQNAEPPPKALDAPRDRTLEVVPLLDPGLTKLDPWAWRGKSPFQDGPPGRQGTSVIDAYNRAPPPVIDWDGIAQGGGGLILCGCRFDRAFTSSVPAVVGRGLTNPIVDLGVAWGDPRNGDPLISVDGRSDDDAPGISRTKLENRTVPLRP